MVKGAGGEGEEREGKERGWNGRDGSIEWTGHRRMVREGRDGGERKGSKSK